MNKPPSDKTQDKINHMRGELFRTRARVTELEGRIIELTNSRDVWRMYAMKLDPKLAAICGEPEIAPKPAGYEHLTHAAIDGIRSTVQTQADRAGQTQDEVFARTFPDGITQERADRIRDENTKLALRAIARQTSAEDPPPHKEDA